MEKRYKSFKQFYPFYLSEHLHPICRGLHFFGTIGVIGLIVLSFYLIIFSLIPYHFNHIIIILSKLLIFFFNSDGQIRKTRPEVLVCTPGRLIDIIDSYDLDLS